MESKKKKKYQKKNDFEANSNDALVQGKQQSRRVDERQTSPPEAFIVLQVYCAREHSDRRPCRGRRRRRRRRGPPGGLIRLRLPTARRQVHYDSFFLLPF